MTALQAGIKLGPYEILSSLGAGGMGEVYRARDTRLDRDVAVKVLPEAMTRDQERMLRFEREAKVLAALNHSAIAAVYGFEEIEDRRLLVMELAEGETLAERLARGPLPVRESLETASAIAQALEAAHEKGIVHRDLKPANVKITPEGAVKVLDFGLAKALSPEASTTDLGTSPTLTAHYTKPGVVLGTAAYMSPEQARGRPVDKRTDIWSFGCVLFECLSGLRPFQGDTATDLVARILERDPDWSQLPPAAPATIQLLLRRLLAKDRNRRLRDIGDARIEIESAIADPMSSSLGLAAVAVDGADRRGMLSVWWRAFPWLVAIASVVLTVVATAIPGRQKPTPSLARVARLTIPVTGMSPRTGQLAIDPNGQYIVYRSEAPGIPTRLNIRPLNEFGERVLGNTAEMAKGWAPFVSPDGKGIGFFTDRDLRVASSSGSGSRRVCEAFGNTTGAWGPDGTIVFSTGRSVDNRLPGLSRVRASGGTPEVLTTVDVTKHELAHIWPEFLPDGQHVLFTIEAGDDPKFRVALLSLTTGEYEVVLENASQPHYAPTGHLIFYQARSDTTFAVPFDVASLRVRGERVEVNGEGTPQVALSKNGTLAYMPYEDVDANIVVLVDRDGNEKALIEQRGPWREPRFSPDGKSVVLRQTQSPDCYLWLYDLERSTLTRLTFDGDSHSPVWGGSGRYVYAGVEGDVMRSIYRTPVDGSAAAGRIWKGGGPEQPGRGPRDGSKIPFEEGNTQGNSDLWVLSLDDEPKAEPFLQTLFNEYSPAFSPEGTWIAYTSDESGRYEVYVRPYPGPGGKHQVSTDGGVNPLWSDDGKELFYERGNALMAVEVTAGSTFGATAPRKLFDGPYLWSDRDLNYDIAPNGQGFVMIKPREGAGLTQELRVVLNWFEELKAKVPVEPRS